MESFSTTSRSGKRLGSRVSQLDRTGAAANDNEPAARSDPSGHVGRYYAVLLLVAIGMALSYWLATAFVDWDHVQACVTLGHRNCVSSIPLDRQ